MVESRSYFNDGVRKAFAVFFVLLFLLSMLHTRAYAQDDMPQFRSDITRLAPMGVLADTINVWGAVRQNGRFVVPRGTTVSQMLSYVGGPNFGRTRATTNIYSYYTRPQVEVYLNRFDSENNIEIAEVWTYRVRDPFPEGMRAYQLQNGEYITVYIRTRPTALQYVLFGISTLGSLAGGFYLIDSLLN
jgi:hypothetical protein